MPRTVRPTRRVPSGAWLLAALALTACAPKAPVPAPAPPAPAYWEATAVLPQVAVARPARVSAYHWRGPGPVGRSSEPLDPADAERLLAVDTTDPDALAGWMRDGTLGLAAVEIDLQSVRVGTRPVATLTGGRLQPGDLRGAVVTPLYEVLVEADQETRMFRELLGLSPRDGALLVVVDARVPSGTLQRVLYTAGQARFAALDVVVQAARTEPARPAPALAPEALRVDVRVEVDGLWVGAAAGGAPTPGRLDQLPDLARAALGGAPGCGRVAAGADVPAERGISALAGLLDSGVHRPTLAFPSPSPPTATVAGEVGPPQAWAPDTSLSVVPIRLPELGPPPEPDAPPCLPDGSVRF